MATFNEFISDHNVTMETKYIGPSEDDKMFEWVVTVKLHGKKLRVDYRMGMAHCEIKFMGYTQNRYKKDQFRIRTITQLTQYGTVIPNKPDLADVLQSIQLDSSVADNYNDKWDFIDEFGYEGREGERIYNLCLDQAKKSKAFFGALYSEFMELEEE